MEATGHARWFERLLAELGFELWIGDPAKIQVKRVRKQKTDRLDAALLLQLLLEDRFPRVWVPSACVSCYGTGIGWCRCGSRISCKRWP
jgi:transposase